MVASLIFPQTTDGTGAYPRFPGAAKWRGCRVGLLGGSFNPAHEGHYHIATEALKRMQLDAVWWLVTPGNPLKTTQHTADLKKRLAAAKKWTRHPKFHLSNIEARLGTRFSVDTLENLIILCPNTDFVWLMGADNMAGFDHWLDWETIAHLLPIAIFDREGYSMPALNSKFARRFVRQRLSPNRAKNLPGKTAPLWCFIPCRKNPASATAIRASGIW